MNERVSVMGDGYLELTESWGSDERIIAEARRTTGGGFVSWEPYAGHPRGDLGLLRHLWRKRHTGPFEFAGLSVGVSAPVAVVWQWVRHRTQSYSVQSSRYAAMPEVDYLPTVTRLMTPDDGNKQAGALGGSRELTGAVAARWLEMLLDLYQRSETTYSLGLAWGVPKELARLALTFGRHFHFGASANLWNWLHFLRLRLAPDAQWEIREYAQAVGRLVARLFPRTWALFEEGL